MKAETKLVNRFFGKGGIHCHCCAPRWSKTRTKLARTAKRRAKAFIARDLNRNPF